MLSMKQTLKLHRIYSKSCLISSSSSCLRYSISSHSYIHNLHLKKTVLCRPLSIRHFSNEAIKNGKNGAIDGSDNSNGTDTTSSSSDSANNTTTTTANPTNNDETNETSKETITNSSASTNTTKSTIRSGPNPLIQFGTFLMNNFQQAWDDMTGKKKESSLKRTVFQANSYKPSSSSSDNDDEDENGNEKSKYTGTTSLVHLKDPVSAWEHMKNRLKDSPLIQTILKSSRKVGKVVGDTDLGKKAVEINRSIKDKIEDAREIWETSQNPIIYTIANAWDNISSETEEGMTIAQIRKLDPGFVKEEWAQEVKTTLVPNLLKAHFLGNIRTLKPWCGEAVYNKLAADIKARKTDGHVFDSNILSLDENQLILKLVEDMGPVIVGVYMVQQINCIRNREGDIVEGAENDIRAKFYSLAFKQEYNEVDSAVSWKVVDFMFVGDIPYI